MRSRRQWETYVGYAYMALTTRYTAKNVSCYNLSSVVKSEMDEDFERHCMLVCTAVCRQWQLTVEHNQHGVSFEDSIQSLT